MEGRSAGAQLSVRPICAPPEIVRSECFGQRRRSSAALTRTARDCIARSTAGCRRRMCWIDARSSGDRFGAAVEGSCRRRSAGPTASRVDGEVAPPRRLSIAWRVAGHVEPLCPRPEFVRGAAAHVAAVHFVHRKTVTEADRATGRRRAANDPAEPRTLESDVLGRVGP